VFFRVSLGHFLLVLRAFVVLGLVFSVLSQEIGWEEHLQKWWILCRMERKTITQSIATCCSMPQYARRKANGTQPIVHVVKFA